MITPSAVTFTYSDLKTCYESLERRNIREIYIVNVSQDTKDIKDLAIKNTNFLYIVYDQRSWGKYEGALIAINKTNDDDIIKQLTELKHLELKEVSISPQIGLNSFEKSAFSRALTGRFEY